MNIGKMRHLITIVYPVRRTDGIGTPAMEWQTFARTKAKYTCVSMRERAAAGGIEATGTACFAFRYIPGVTEDMRVIWEERGSVWEIVSALESADGKYLTLRVNTVRGEE